MKNQILLSAAFLATVGLKAVMEHRISDPDASYTQDLPKAIEAPNLVEPTNSISRKPISLSLPKYHDRMQSNRGPASN